MVCPVCSCGAVEQLYRMSGFELVKCPGCGLVYQSGIETLDEACMIREIYDDNWVRMKEHAAVGDLYGHYVFSSHLVDSHSCPGGNLLEIGSGTGEFLYLMKLMGRHVTGVEPSEKSCEFAKNRYQLDLVHSMWDVSIFDDTQRFDAIVFWHVLEHMPSPEMFLAEVASLLRDGGKIFFCVPNNECVDNQLLQYASPLYTERDHLFHYSIKNLPLLLEKAGLTAEMTFLWEGPGRLKADWELCRRLLPEAAFREFSDEYVFLAWLRNNRKSYELFCIAGK